nr:hypothetical protein [Tanacetum cinerariifolium]
MVVDVDLKCSECYKKVKKIIGPERVRGKLSYKGEKSIQKIEIIVDKPNASSTVNDDKPKPKPKPKESDKPKGDNDKPKGAEAPPKGDTSPKIEVAKMMFEPPVDGHPQMYPPMTTYPMVGYGYL